MGKTAVFVLATLQQLEIVDGQVSVIVLCHTRELAFQISKEYDRFAKYMPDVKTSVFFGGMNIKKDQDTLKKNCPHIVVGTPGRILALTRERSLNLKNIKHFVLDECDKMLESLDMRRDVQDIFRLTPHEKQVRERIRKKSLLSGFRRKKLKDRTMNGDRSLNHIRTPSFR